MTKPLIMHVVKPHANNLANDVLAKFASSYDEVKRMCVCLQTPKSFLEHLINVQDKLFDYIHNSLDEFTSLSMCVNIDKSEMYLYIVATIQNSVGWNDVYTSCRPIDVIFKDDININDIVDWLVCDKDFLKEIVAEKLRKTIGEH